MNITSILKITAAFVALSISAYAAEVFSVTTSGTDYPVTSAASFNAVDADGNFTNPYNTFGNLPDIGAGSGVVIATNFDGANSAINTGDQITTGANTTTYFGPKFYAGVNRDVWQQSGTVLYSNGNGYRIRSNNVSAALIGTAQVGTAQVGTAQVGTAQVGVEGDADYAPASADYAPASADYAPASGDYAEATGNGGLPLQTRVIFMFDADTSSLSGADDNLIFSDSDTLTAKLVVPGQMGANRAVTPSRTNNMASLATYRAVVKANGEYYAGSLYSVDLAALPDIGNDVRNMSENGYDATWTLMSNIEKSSHNMGQETNLIVDNSASTIAGKFLTNITQVGFLLETETNVNTGGYNFGVREFIANATPASADHPIEWSQDFASTLNFLTTVSGNKVYDGAVDPANLLTGTEVPQVGEVGDVDYAAAVPHAYKWSTSGAGLTATPASTITQANGQVVLALNGTRADAGAVKVHMIGPGTTNARRVRPPSHETTFVFDLINWKAGQADINIQTYGHDGYVRSVLSPSGNVKYTTYGTNYTHTNFNNFSGPTKLRSSTNAANNGIVIVDGGTVDPAAGGVVEVDISGNAEGTVVLNGDSSAVASVTITNYGSGYTGEPTLTWTGMSVDPTVSFNYETGNIIRQNVVATSMRDVDGNGVHGDTGDLPVSLLNDGQILTYIQSYDNADDSISYYYSLDDADPVFITKLTAADHSPGGTGFFDFTTGNKYGQPNNQNAVAIEYKQWGDPGGQAASFAINSVTVATSDDDRDGVVNRDDALPNDPFESADADSDGVGDNSDAHPGYNDSVVSAGITQAVWDASQTALTTAQTAQATAETDLTTAQADLTTAQADLTTAQADLTTAQADLTTAQADLTTAQAELANSLTLSDIQDLRAGSTMIAVSDGSATVSLQMEESSDLSSWSNLGDAVDFTANLGAGDDTQFFRVKLAD